MGIGGATSAGPITYGYSQTHTIAVRVFDSVGQVSATSTASATTAAPPPAQIVVTKGAPRRPLDANCASTSCAFLHVQVLNMAPNTRYVFSTFSSTTGNTFASFSRTTPKP